MIELRVIGCFGLRVDGVRVDVSGVPARLLAYLALQHGAVGRSVLASVLWPEVPHERALGNLRSALWRLPGGSRAAIAENGPSLRLAPDVCCDLAPVLRRSAPLRTGQPGPPDVRDLLAWAWRDELLAGWYDDWVLEARDAVQERRADLLEELATASRAAGRRDDALMYATLAVGAQPLRESAHRTLLRAHLDVGQVTEAWGLYHELEAMLLHDLGVLPCGETTSVLASAAGRAARVEVA